MARIRIKSSYVPEAGCRGLGPAHGGDERNAIDDLDVEREGDALPAEVQDELIDELRVGDREAADDNAPDAGQKQGIDLLRRPESPRNLQLLRRGAGERSEEHTSELQSLMRISYAVFCLKKKK